MTIERAIEILDPGHREHYGSIEPVNEACRMGIEALTKCKQLGDQAAAWDDSKIPNGRVCTSCGTGVFKDIFFRGGNMNYCPNCGKQMRNA